MYLKKITQQQIFMYFSNYFCILVDVYIFIKKLFSKYANNRNKNKEKREKRNPEKKAIKTKVKRQRTR